MTPQNAWLGVMCEFDLFGVVDCKYLKLRLSCFGRSGRNLDMDLTQFRHST